MAIKALAVFGTNHRILDWFVLVLCSTTNVLISSYHTNKVTTKLVERLKNNTFSNQIGLGLTFFVIPALALLVFINLVPLSIAQTAESAYIELDRESYPVPWGTPDDFKGTPLDYSPVNRSLFPLHLTAVAASGGIVTPDDIIGNGDVIIHVQVHDPDFNKSLTEQEQISQAGFTENGELASHGMVKVYVTRGDESVLLATAGYQKSNGDTGRLTLGTDVDESDEFQTREIGPIMEIEPENGIFEFSIAIRYTDGPASKTCPLTTSYVSASNGTRSDDYLSRFDEESAPVDNHCILNGDVLTVEYVDAANTDNPNTLKDSATFSLTTGQLQTDKDVYVIGSKSILTLTDPDLNLDSKIEEAYPLDLIEWDSFSATTTMGAKGGHLDAFNPVPSEFRETGPNTGMFQMATEIPVMFNNDTVQRGEEIMLEYTDWGVTGAEFVGRDDEDVTRAIYTSNFGAIIELDQQSYMPTDKAYITVTSPDHNLDSETIDHIGVVDNIGAVDYIGISNAGELKILTNEHSLTGYRLDETGPNTGIFTGEVTLNDKKTSGVGPNDGLLQVGNSDGITVSFEFSGDETIVGSAVIQNLSEPDDGIMPPVRQIASGVPADKIQCKEPLQLIYRSSSENLVCIKPESREKLIERGWAKPV